MTEEGGLLEANPIWTSPYERHGARLVPLRRSAEQGLFCWRLGSSGLLQHGICRSRLLFWSASFGTGVSALSASLASFLRHFALLLCFMFFYGGGGGDTAEGARVRQGVQDGPPRAPLPPARAPKAPAPARPPEGRLHGRHPQPPAGVKTQVSSN